MTAEALDGQRDEDGDQGGEGTREDERHHRTPTPVLPRLPAGRRGQVCGDPNGIRTRVAGMKTRCPDLTRRWDRGGLSRA